MTNTCVVYRQMMRLTENWIRVQLSGKSAIFQWECFHEFMLCPTRQKIAVVVERGRHDTRSPQNA